MANPKPAAAATAGADKSVTKAIDDAFAAQVTVAFGALALIVMNANPQPGGADNIQTDIAKKKFGRDMGALIRARDYALEAVKPAAPPA